MHSKIVALLSVLFLAAAAASAQNGATPMPWSEWQPASTSDGAASTALEYRWQSTAPCKAEGCKIEVQMRNTGAAPAQFRYSIYFDAPESKSKGEAQPKTDEATIAAAASSSQFMTGAKVTRVVVELEGGGSKADTWGPYDYALLYSGDDLTPDATLNILETLSINSGTVTIAAKRGGGGADPSKTGGVGSHTQMCTPLTVQTAGTRQDDGNGELYIPSPLWEVDMTCAEGPAAAVLFLSQNDATSFVERVNSIKKK